MLDRITTGEIEQQIDEIVAKNQEALDRKEWMAPTASKRNWDIKRDFHRKLEKLEKRTESAMVSLIRRQVLEAAGRASAKQMALDKGEEEGVVVGAVAGKRARSRSPKGGEKEVALTKENIRDLGLDAVEPSRHIRMEMLGARLENLEDEDE